MHKWILMLVTALLASSCASSGATTTFVSSWRSPTAQPLHVKGSKVAVSVMLSDLASRRSAEDKLASEITARGGKGVPMYQILESGGDENAARAALTSADVQGVVVMTPAEADLTSNTPINYGAPPYNTYWNGYFDYAPASPPSSKPVAVDTLIYSLRQNQLVWAGKSKTTDAKTLDNLVAEVSAATADELKRLMLLGQ